MLLCIVLGLEPSRNRNVSLATKLIIVRRLKLVNYLDTWEGLCEIVVTISIYSLSISKVVFDTFDLNICMLFSSANFLITFSLSLSIFAPKIISFIAE
jgi:hypothetical protein